VRFLEQMRGIASVVFAQSVCSVKVQVFDMLSVKCITAQLHHVQSAILLTVICNLHESNQQLHMDVMNSLQAHQL